ncbi:MAG: YgjV family protein [Salinisphaera sp.]|jgi:hypothetical protein|nr:YgjV family protein [Salinisphaera sp.]
MHDIATTRWIVGQLFGLVALILCVIGFANKRDDRLFVRLLAANVAFALQFIMFQSWVAAAIAILIVLRIHLVRRHKGNAKIMWFMLAATFIVAVPTWSGPRDLWALAAGAVGTYGMFISGCGVRSIIVPLHCRSGTYRLREAAIYDFLAIFLSRDILIKQFPDHCLILHMMLTCRVLEKVDTLGA